MELVYRAGEDLKTFFQVNQGTYDAELKSLANETFSMAMQTKGIDEMELLSQAHQLTEMLIDGAHIDIIQMAKERGISWSRQELPVMTQLSWFQAVRRVIWKFFNFYYAKVGIDVQQVFDLEYKTNELLDTFVDHFFASFAKYRDNLIKAQRDLIEELSVPVIPILDETAVLPLIGTLDTHRAKKVQEHVLSEINGRKIHKLIIDLSGVAFLDSAVVKHLFRIVDGVKLLGCRAILVGIRPEIANTMIEQRIPLDEKVEVHSTLQQALIER